jgi:hypothetical protein
LNTATTTQNIEGIPTTEERATYGGTDDDDNSGIFRYVSIRHGGDAISSGNEINGLTLAGVGSGTTIDHVEVVFNQDDGVEFFGSTVNTSHLVTAFCGDDAFDYDLGYRGKGQFWFAIQDADESDRAGEHDGGKDPEDGQPYSMPEIYNATYIGGGDTSLGGDNRLLYFRDNAGGKYRNSIFHGFGRGVLIEFLPETQEDSYARWQAGQLEMTNNRFSKIGFEGDSASFASLFSVESSDASFPDSAANIANAFQGEGNETFSSAPIQTLNREGNGRLMSNGLNPAPVSALSSGAPTPTGNFFEPVNYYGAFGPGENWLKGWTFLDTNGFVE